MNGVIIVSITDKLKTLTVSKGLELISEYLEKDPEENISKVMNMVDKIFPHDLYSVAREMIHETIDKKDNMYQLILYAYQLDAGVRRAFFNNFFVNATLNGSKIQDEYAAKYNCNVPWAILLDPTSACNLHCTGCWAAEYGHNYNLDYDTIDSIIRQGKKLGIYMYIYTGGEPTVRKNDLMKLCTAHSDCEFLAFTNGTLIDDSFCNEMLRVKNFIPAISLEGFEAANDNRRGKGAYQKATHAMALLKDHKLPFGLSVCYTSANFNDINSEAFFDKMIDMGAMFSWFFHYMPVGNDAVPSLMVTPQQRTALYRHICQIRNTKPLFCMDFQDDGIHVGGCIAGGRRYLHINAKGDVEPCVFIHYSNTNIHNTTLLDALRSPIFQAYHDNQPFNSNHFRPCPMLENPQELPRLVKNSHAVNTDYCSPESAEHLCHKCEKYAANWQPVADELWSKRIAK
jgi:MoaA/NifB/PqqE/SkfB family radical SAM enzyme